jgi:hypothetical protein
VGIISIDRKYNAGKIKIRGLMTKEIKGDSASG